MKPKQKYAFAVAMNLVWSDELRDLGVFESATEVLKVLQMAPSALTATERSEIFQVLSKSKVLE